MSSITVSLTVFSKKESALIRLATNNAAPHVLIWMPKVDATIKRFVIAECRDRDVDLPFTVRRASRII